ncbi:MAG: glycerol-3-phosphate dehydrogenase/oxidase, partial [Deltaproteobacteria bacterium]|nr:glycerol-3-phosphate dehydrogenase/oxidase [Deltaproteobacteria bacterium]
MKRFIEQYEGEIFDLLIIGGGITGAAVAYDAASRGLSVALVEKQDFGCATSAATSKLIHGGLRYLSNLEFALVRESLRERRIMENIAPNLVYPLPVLLTSYNRVPPNDLRTLKKGMIVYDLLSFDKGWTWDKSKKLPRHQTIPPEKVIDLEPAMKKEGLQGGHIFYDCSSIFPERLTLAFVKSAVQYGAKVSNYTKAEGFLQKDEKTVCGIRVKDLLSGKRYALEGKLCVNCGGPWADIILKMVSGGVGDTKMVRSEGIHVITKRLTKNHLVTLPASGGKRYLFKPWRRHTLIGITDRQYAGDPDDYKVTKGSILELLEDVNEFIRDDDRLQYEDILYAYGGLRPLVENT